VHWKILVIRAARAHAAIKPARQLEIMTYARIELKSRLIKTTIEILTQAIDGAQNFCIIHDPCKMLDGPILSRSYLTYELNTLPFILGEGFDWQTDTIKSGYNS
jgi:hypothetical protein